MTILVIAFLFMLVLMAAMAIGVLMGRAPISGSCGGMKALGMDVDCEICGGDPALCDTNDDANLSQPIQRGEVHSSEGGKPSASDIGKRIGR